jgi:hypothetical protein
LVPDPEVSANLLTERGPQLPMRKFLKVKGCSLGVRRLPKPNGLDRIVEFKVCVEQIFRESKNQSEKFSAESCSEKGKTSRCKRCQRRIVKPEDGIKAPQGTLNMSHCFEHRDQLENQFKSVFIHFQ